MELSLPGLKVHRSEKSIIPKGNWKTRQHPTCGLPTRRLLVLRTGQFTDAAANSSCMLVLYDLWIF